VLPLGRGRGIDMNFTPNNNNNTNSQATGPGAGRGAHLNTPAWLPPTVEQQRRSALRRMLERMPMAEGLRNGSMPPSFRKRCFELFPDLQNSVERLQQLLDQETTRMQ